MLNVPSLDLLRCPSCRGGQLLVAENGLVCGTCERSAQHVEGTLDLRLDPDQDSALDVDSYDEAHDVDADQARGLFDVYNIGFQLARVGQAGGRVLEIDSGTGNLTLAMARYSQYSEIHCSDISLRFMRAMETKLDKSDRTKLFKYLFDANSFPFQGAQFDAVVGNSILHHLIDFENTLAECQRVLKPGGVAVFGEPMIETNALVYLAAAQVLAVDAMLDEPRLDSRTRHIMKTVSEIGGQKMRNLLERDAKTEALEDKFIFPKEHMRETARQLGFADYFVVEYAPVNDIAGIIVREFRRIIGPTKADLDAVLSYQSLFSAFNQSYLPTMGPFVGQTFALNVFIR